MNDNKLVTQDVVIFESPSKSKAGMDLTFKAMLIRSNSDIKLDRADRISKGAHRAYTKLLMDLEAKQDAIIESIEASKDLSTSNSRDSMNAIDSFDAERWVSKFQANSVELELVGREIKIAEDNFGELFHDDVDTETGEVLQDLPSSGKKKT